MDQENNKIAICICTYMRPKMLKDLLNSVSLLHVPHHSEIVIIIIDNDENKTAKAVFEETKIEFQSYYFSEISKGLDFVRNRALKESISLNCDYLAFIDDDETAEPNWISQLYKTAREYRADIVAGRVIYHLPKGSPEWMLKPGFFNKAPMVTGAERKVIGAGNVLIDLKKVKEHNVWFRNEFRFSGGEDTFFFQELIRQGCKAVHCHEAVTIEKVPESRANIKWLYQRSFMYGYIKAKRKHLRHGFIAAQMYIIPLMGSLLLQFGVGSLVEPFFKTSFSIKNRRKWHRIRGLLFATKGGNLESYKVTHGY